jgi:hypothetical protein
MFKKKEQVKPGVAFAAMPPEGQAWIRDAYMNLMHLAAETTNEWAIECIKHLAIINGAGLAGAATLAGLGTTLIGADPMTAAKWFLIGLFLAFVCLYMGFDMNERGMRRFRKRLDSFFDGSGTTADMSNLEPVGYKRAIIVVALISAVAFVTGVSEMLPFELKSLAHLFRMN